jgi:hypothetical protein
MIRLLCLVFVGDWHRHKWTVLREISVFENGYVRPVGLKYHLRCTECGDVKAKTL